ncbi:MAG: hypothetical protein IVW57_16565 [Ktedonobacterales bacterium]|nr:hypothetical protein [Ktedonobacterales bacterium]
MDPEEMDVVELAEDVPVDPSWHVKAGTGPEMLRKGERGMVIHRAGDDPALFDVEFMDAVKREPLLLAKLRAAQLRVVERYTLGQE